MPAPSPSIAPDAIAHVIRIALAPAFLLTALATLLTVFSTRLGRVADMVDAAVAGLRGAGADDAIHLSRQLSYLRRRSFMLDVAVVLASAGGIMTGIAVLTLFAGALRDAATATVLFGCFGVALVCTVAAVAAFLIEILMAGRGVRDEGAGRDPALGAVLHGTHAGGGRARRTVPVAGYQASASPPSGLRAPHKTPFHGSFALWRPQCRGRFVGVSY